jgi:hypothetical protein
MIYDGDSLSSCYARLKELTMMKGTYAVDKGLEDGDPIDPVDFRNHFEGKFSKCPGGGTYTCNKIGERPVCSFAGTRGLKPKKQLVGYFWWRWKIPPAGRHELLEMPLPNPKPNPYE